MKVTIELNNLQEIQQLLSILKELNIEHFSIIEKKPNLSPELETNITKGDHSVDPSELFGIWKDNPKTLENIRKKGWQRNWNTTIN